MDDLDLATWMRYEKIMALYEKHPVIYKLRIALLVVFTFVLVLGILAVFVLSIVCREWLFAALILFVSASYLYAVISSQPWKHEFFLDPEQYCALYGDVAEMCRELRVRCVDRIYLSMVVPLCMVSHLAFMPFLRKNVLVIGYPAVCSMDAKSLRVCIMHELGHLAAARPLDEMARNFLAFFWSVTHFSRLYDLPFFPLEAEQEKAADESCRTTFAFRDFTTALTQLVAGEALCDDEQISLSLSEVEKGGDLAGVYRDFRRKLPDDDKVRRTLERLLRSANPINDPHPAFRDRIGTDDVETLLACLKRTPDAAEHYLLACPRFEQDFNAHLEKDLRESLDAYKKSLEEIGKKLDELDMSSDDPDTFSGALRPARTLGRTELFRQCVDILRERFPDSLSARATVLSVQMDEAASDREEAEAAGKLEQIALGNPMLALQFIATLKNYWLRQGDLAKVKQMLFVEAKAQDRMRKAFNAKLSMDDILITSDIPDHYVSDIGKFITPSLGVEKFYLVTRRYDSSVALGTLFLYLVRKPRMRSFHLAGASDEDVIGLLSSALANYNVFVRIATKKELKVLEARGIPAHFPAKRDKHARAAGEKQKK